MYSRLCYSYRTKLTLNFALVWKSKHFLCIHYKDLTRTCLLKTSSRFLYFQLVASKSVDTGQRSTTLQTRLMQYVYTYFLIGIYLFFSRLFGNDILNLRFSFYLARYVIVAHLEQLQLVPNLLKIFGTPSSSSCNLDKRGTS